MCIEWTASVGKCRRLIGYNTSRLRNIPSPEDGWSEMFNCVQVWVAAIMTSPLRTLISVDLDSHGCLCLMRPHPSPNSMTGESGFHGRRLRRWSPPPLMGRSSDDVGSGGETRGSKERCHCSFPPSWVMPKLASPIFVRASLFCPSPFGLMHRQFPAPVCGGHGHTRGLGTCW